jgi:NADH-quinone oxidoreductase subunit J
MSEWIVYLALGVVSIVSALGLLFSRNAVYAALFLVLNFGVAAVLYLMMNAPFLAAVQVTVYAGAIMVLFVFCIMLLGAERLPAADSGAQIRASRYVVIASVAVLLVSLVYALMNSGGSGDVQALADASPAAVGRLLYGTYGFPFEAVSILLTAAMVGAVVLAKDLALVKKSGDETQ